MILTDSQARAQKKDDHREPKTADLDRQLPRGAKKEELEQFIKKRKLAEWFWRPADRPGWPYGVELGWIFVGFVIVFGLVAALIILIELNSIGALVIGGILVVALAGIQLKGRILRFLFGGRNNEEEIEALNISDRYQYSFANGRDDILFIRDAYHLIGLALFRYKATPIDPEGSFQRFIRSVYERQVPLFWHHQQVPFRPDEVIKYDFSPITDEARDKFAWKQPHKRASDLGNQGGIWGGRIIFGSQRAFSASDDCEATRRIISEQLISDLHKIKHAFRQTFTQSVFEPLLGQDLIVACQHSMRCSAPISFYTTGYEAVEQFLRLPQIITKSLPFDFPEEHVVRRRIPHDVSLGRAFDTESQKSEVVAGFKSQDLFKGVLISGGTMEERFQTNAKLVHAAAGEGVNYLVITDNPDWRCMLKIMPTACLLRLGDELIWNALDPNDSEVIEYALLLMQVFAQLFHLSANGCQWLSGAINNCLLENQRDLIDLGLLAEKIGDLTSGANSGMTRELGVVYKFLTNIRLGKISTILGATNIPLKNLVQGVNILEIDIKNRKHLQFLCSCFLAKILAFSRSNPDQEFMVLVDMGDVLVPLDPQAQRARDSEQYLLEWVRRFREMTNVGLHLSVQTPARFTKVVLTTFLNILVHRTTSYEDVRRIQDLLQFLPDKVVFSKGVRHNNWALESLKRLPPNRLIMKHPDLNIGFPVDLAPLDLPSPRTCSGEEIRARLKSFFPDWTPFTLETRSVLERDFPRNTKVVRDLLSLLDDYDRLSTTNLLSALNSDPEIDIDKPMLDPLLFRLIDLNYILRDEQDEGRGFRRLYYKLTDKGKMVYRDHVEALRARLERLVIDPQGNDENDEEEDQDEDLQGNDQAGVRGD